MDLLEQGLPLMLAEARCRRSISGWTRRLKKVDAPIMDLAEAEIAFHHGEAPDVGSHWPFEPLNDYLQWPPDVSRAYYIAGTSARMDYHHRRCPRTTAIEAFATAASVTADQRDAVLGPASLDLDSTTKTRRTSESVSSSSTMGVPQARCDIALLASIVGCGEATLKDLRKPFASAEHVTHASQRAPRSSSFYMMHAAFLAIQGRYSAARRRRHSAAKRYATEIRGSPSSFPYARRVRAIARLGLRHFSRCADDHRCARAIRPYKNSDIFLARLRRV